MFASVSDAMLRTGTLVSMLAMAGLIGSRWCGRHGGRVRIAVTILYIAAILVLVCAASFRSVNMFPPFATERVVPWGAMP